jgi:phosphinothricin acetyltransferase
MEIRLATDADSEAIRAIYNLEVLTTTVTFDLVARSEDDQRAWMAAHSGVYPVIVAEQSGEVIGFASLSPYRSRPAYSTTAEDSVYVHQGYRGQGIGRALLGELMDLAEVHGFHSVMARIVGHHATSIALHRSVGFELVGIEHEVGRKFGKWLDVALMQRLFGPLSSP